LETDQLERRRTLRVNWLIAGRQRIKKKVFNSTHDRTHWRLVALQTMWSRDRSQVAKESRAPIDSMPSKKGSQACGG
jgi:hypothetical protein